MINISTRNLFVRAGFDASGMISGTRQANNALRQFGQNANKQMSSLSNTVSSSMSKIGKLLAGAFAVKAIVNFGKECLQLGSDLQEEQNVVDVTFGDMAESINEFARTSVENFGLSETAAKKYAGVFGSMSLSMGLTRQQALEMSKSVVALTGDVASFFNLSNDVAYTKLKSIWTGETETLKDLGVVMTQANLKQFALSQGIGKSIDKMTEAEKVMLRYEYVTKALSNTQGDFARNIDSWANQIRVLSEQFNAFKATIGQGLIVALTPVVKGLNLLIGKLRIAAGYFKAFMELLFGKQSVSEGAGMADIADSTESITDSASGASDAVEGIGDSAKKAAKKAKGALASFDELNVIGTKDSDSGSSGGSGLDNMGGAVEVDLGETVEQTDKLTTMFDGVIAQLTKMKELFSSGFKIGFETANLDALNSAIANIKTGFMNVFGDGSILSSFTNMLKSMALSAGSTVGAWASMGVTIATNLIGGIGSYLNQNAQYIKDRLIGIFDAWSEISDMWSEYIIAFADIFSVFGGEAGQQITANIIGMFSNGFLGILELATKLGRDIMKCITKPIVDNKESLKKALEGTLEVISVVTGTLKDLITNTMKKAVEVYDEYLAPAFENIKDGFSEIVEALLDAYNIYIQPTLMRMAESWNSFYTDSLKPVVDKALEVFGKLIEGGSKIYKEFVAPLVAWAVDLLAPQMATAFENISEAFKTAGEIILDIVDKLLDVFDGLIDFIVGVFTGDWDRAWEGIKTIFKGIVDTFHATMKEPIDKVLEWVKGAFTRSWTTAWNNVKNVFGTAFNGLKSLAKAPLNYIIDLINSAIKGVNKVTSTVNKIPGVNIGTIPQIPKLAKGGVLRQSTIVEAGEYAGARHNPEIVTPQNLMYDTVMSANSELATSFFNAARMIVGAIENKDLNVSIGDDAIGKSSVNYINRQTKIKGVSPIMV